ncbi:MAG TPA: 4-hydroxy-tetrahydrodipicolinate synthase [Candidatus Fermentibacter daniensis]|jgi:4-hydroxy-tetrahydrodipicolinate synthase|nr:MAG: 4-hydroxy-tetrahydrodipicolinate synthase [Candidatus Fermentibacter daniensis]MBP7720619.1 4-hydroxy-tetrahydrodipicolinate synthase [Candidatus Fermentibacter sp.]NLI02815.1 4-hydroxy-tetrahydrodipicolinate synthase [Candidatus Fermentibacter daniensis]HOA04681.1 4-hydroxy-tetrahydrodipicolinate synthase [Candidatus Fermentibacter daniensis]HOD18867.1 4-hydroxy-tetrahydrodipicolinate synthase [Candidatus Fermentibacter daniensis]
MKRFTGAWTALVTPFRNGAVDYEALGRLIDMQIDEGIDGLVACGCTGEAATLRHDEHLEVVRFTVARAAGRVPVIGGSGKNDTAQTVALSKEVSALGVDGLLVITPYYNKPTQEGLVAHFEAVAGASDSPVVVYNVPGRTGVSIAPATVAKLAAHPGIVCIKEAGGAVERVTAIRTLCDIGILSGDDHLALAEVATGADGVISVVSNVAPAATAEMMRLGLDNRFDAARKINNRLYPLIGALFVESNPIPVKCALAMMGIIENELRLPLTPMRQDLRGGLEAAMRTAGLL